MGYPFRSATQEELQDIETGLLALELPVRILKQLCAFLPTIAKVAEVDVHTHDWHIQKIAIITHPELARRVHVFFWNEKHELIVPKDPFNYELIAFFHKVQ